MDAPFPDNDTIVLDSDLISSRPPPTANQFKRFVRPRKRHRHHRIRVRPNPKNYVINFKGASTTEEKLSKLLDGGRQSISLVGLPGCGKTVILRAMAYHAPIAARFYDGIFLIPLSYCTYALTLFAYLSKILDYLNLAQHATKIRNITGLPEKTLKDVSASDMNGENVDVDIRDIDLSSVKTNSWEVSGETISKATAHLVDAIYNKHVLLLFDNLDVRAQEVLNVIHSLNRIIPRSRQLSLVCSTRNRDVALKFASNCSAGVLEVKLHDPLGEMSRAILCTHAGHKPAQLEEESRIPENAVVPVLQKCSGISLALAVAGGAIRRLQSCPNESIERKIWNCYRTFIFNDVSQFGTLSKLFPALHACVETLPTLTKDKWEVICSLGVFPNATWLPLQILKRLWGISLHDADEIIHHLLLNYLARKEKRDMDYGIVVPNLILDFCRVEASKRGGLRKWHLTLLSSFTNHESKASGPREHEGSYVDSVEQFYLELHLSHHYKGAITVDTRPPPDSSDAGQRSTTRIGKSDLDLARYAKKIISERILNLSKNRPIILYRDAGTNNNES